jgi:hypothetical protein
MRARRVAAGSELRFFQDEQAIGYVGGTAVSFQGFDTPDDAVPSRQHPRITRI